MEKVTVIPGDVRGLGDIVSSKSASDFTGVDASITEGTDSGLGKVFTLSGSLTPDSLVLTGDKSIFQTGDTLTLDGTLSTSVGHLVSGKVVGFYTTDDSVSFFKGSETFTKVTGSGSPTIEYTSSNELKYTSAGSALHYSDIQFRAVGDWECTFKVKGTGTDGGKIGLYPASNTGVVDGQQIAFKLQSSLYVSVNDTNTASNLSNTSMGSYTDYHTVKISVSDGSASIYYDNTLKKTVELSWLDEWLCFACASWTSGNVIYVKDFKFRDVI